MQRNIKEKKDGKKKSLAYLLILFLTAAGMSAAPFGCVTTKADGDGQVFPATDEEGNEYTYRELESGGIEIASFTGPESPGDLENQEPVEITVPSALDGKQVVRIGSGAYSGEDYPYCKYIAKITVPEGITSIGEFAFTGCTKLEGLVLPDSLETMERNMIAGCCLTEITVPRGVKAIDHETFDACETLTAIRADQDNLVYASQDGILYNKEKTALLCCPRGFGGDFTVPETVTVIGEKAFSACYGLTDITIAASVADIEREAFWNCHSLQTVAVPGNVKTMGERAFSFCSGLKELILEEGIETIEKGAFDNCYGLTTVTIPASVKNMGDGQGGAYDKYDTVFEFCTALTEINVTEGSADYESDDGVLYDKGKKTLLFCPAGKEGEVRIPASAAAVGNEVFDYCTAVTGIQAAEGNANYESDDGVLYNKGKKELLFCPMGKEGEIRIPASVTVIDVDYVFDRDIKLTAINVDPANTVYASDDGVLYDKEKTVLLICPKWKTKPESVRISVPDTVRKISDNAFKQGWPSHVTLISYQGSPVEEYVYQNGGVNFEASRAAYTYTITFDANGGTNTGEITSLAVTEGKTIGDMGMELPAAVRAGYDFLGWYTARTGGGRITGETWFTGSQTVYAHWAQRDVENGSDEPGQPDETVKGGQDEPKQPDETVKDGQDEPGQADKAVSYIVRFKKNGGSKVSKASVTVTSGKAIGKLPTAQRKGYSFQGWYTGKKGGEKITSSMRITKDQTVYAQWKKVTKPKKPGKPSLKSKKKGQVTVSFSKVSAAKGYEICYSTKKNFKGAKKTMVSKTKAGIKKLKRKTVYYVKIRAYKLDSTGNKVYGNYSAAGKLRTK